MNHFLLETTAANAGSIASMIIPLVLIVGFFYFFMLRPQKKQEREVNSMRDNLQIGDEVSTNGGIIGRVVKIKDDIITLELGSDKTKIKVFKWAIRAVEVPINPPEEAPALPKKPKKSKDDSDKPELKEDKKSEEKSSDDDNK